MSEAKDEAIVELVRRLDIAARRWIAVDHGDGDRCAIGIARDDEPQRLVHVSTSGKRPGRYDYACKMPDGSEPTGVGASARGDDVDWQGLVEALEAHLHVDEPEPLDDDEATVAGLERLTAGLRALIGQPCWSVSAGPRASVAMDLGDKLRRGQPLKNPQLSDEQRRFIGEYWLLVQCAWRLDGPHGVVCASGDGPGGAIAAGLASLVGRTVTAFAIHAPAHDLVLSFGAERRLTIFCDRSHGDGDTYTIAIPGRTVGVQPGGVIAHEPRAMPAAD